VRGPRALPTSNRPPMLLLNNREISVLVWLFIAAVALPSLSRPLLGLLWSRLSQPHIARSLGLMAAFTTACVWLLHRVGFWEIENAKTTLVWFAGVSVSWAFDFERFGRDPNVIARHALVEALGIAAIVSFVVGTVTFSLWVELVLVPASSILAFSVPRKGDKDPSIVSKFSIRALSVFGILLLVAALYQMAAHHEAFFTKTTAREFFSPIALSIALTAALYAVNVKTVYGMVFSHMGRSLHDDAALKRAAIKMSIRSFGLDIAMLRRWQRYASVTEFESVEQLRTSFATVRAARARELDPPQVREEDGLSPYAAMEFLSSAGLATEGYNLAFEGRWGGSTAYRWLGEKYSSDHLEYQVSGTELAATRIELALNVRNAEDGEGVKNSRAEFTRAAAILLKSVFGDHAERVSERLGANRLAQTRSGCFTAWLEEEHWGHAFERTLVITHRKEVDPFLGRFPRAARVVVNS
jgi:hypothetical protein